MHAFPFASRSLPLLLLLATACPPPDTCTDEARASVEITVEDEAGAPIAHAVAHYMVDEEDPVDCTGSAGVLSCGSEVAGTLEIQVGAQGYETEALTVEVEADACHVQTEQRVVTLTPLGCEPIAMASMEVWVFSAGDGVPAGVAVTYAPESGGDAEACEHQSLLGYWVCGVEETGTFVVTASADGHVTDSQTIEVGQGECNVITEEVTFTLAQTA